MYAKYHLHFNKFTGKPLYNCVECNLPFSSEKYLQKHIKTTGHKNDNLVCDICGSIFDLHAKLQAHIQRSHNNCQ